MHYFEYGKTRWYCLIVGEPDMFGRIPVITSWNRHNVEKENLLFDENYSNPNLKKKLIQIQKNETTEKIYPSISNYNWSPNH